MNTREAFEKGQMVECPKCGAEMLGFEFGSSFGYECPECEHTLDLSDEPEPENKVVIRPNSGTNEVEVSDGTMVLDDEDAITLMEALKAEGHKFRVEFRAYGFRLSAGVEKKALELAGLTGLKAAKYTKGFVEF